MCLDRYDHKMEDGVRRDLKVVERTYPSRCGLVLLDILREAQEKCKDKQNQQIHIYEDSSQAKAHRWKGKIAVQVHGEILGVDLRPLQKRLHPRPYPKVSISSGIAFYLHWN